MATAVSKPTSQPPKMKRPPPPFSQAGVNGVKAHQPSSSPQLASKRPPGSFTATSSPNLANGVANVANPAKGPLNRTRNQSQKLADASSRLGRPLTRAELADSENRSGRTFPEPYGEAFQQNMSVPRILANSSLSSQLKPHHIFSINTPNILHPSSCIFI